MIRPPKKNPNTAYSKGSCRLDNPEIAWPEVHPPAYLVPNPTKKPPIMIIIIPYKVNKFSQLKISLGRSGT